MSYILEALRKVERQRRGRAIPDLATVHGPGLASRRIWVPVVSGVLLINAGLLAVLLWYRAGTPPVSSPTAQGTAPATDTAAPPPAEPLPSAGASVPPPAPADSSAVAPSPAARAAPGPSTKPRVGGPGMPDPRPSAESGPRVRITVPDSDAAREVSVARGAGAATPESPPPTASGGASAKAAVPADLPASFRAAVSQLRLEALVYAQAPQDRKVFINGRRYQEGETLDDGILVEKIVEEGAVLSYRGHRYVLRHFR